METNKQSKEDNTSIPRILALKLDFGDNFVDYIKDEIGVENFLEEIFLQEENKKRNFLLNNPQVIDFLKKWVIFVQKYKNLYGQHVRDADAITHLRTTGILQDDSLYKFRNKIFKADFCPDEIFLSELVDYLKILEDADSKIDLEINQKNKELINNKIW